MLKFDEEVVVPTYNLSKIVYNKCLKELGNKMIDVYNATINNFTQATLQS